LLRSVGVALCFLSVWPVSAEDGHRAAVEPVTDVIKADGVWGEVDRGQAPGAQTWSLDALRMGTDQVRGRITVSGSSLVSSANVEGVLSGRGVYGKLLDDAGMELATFEGALTKAGASGTYRDRAGAVGAWQWQGQPTQSAP